MGNNKKNPVPPTRLRAQQRQVLTAALGTSLPDDLLTQALTHRSYAYEAGGVPHNERLEFLGDAVLEIVTVERLYRRHPDLTEHDLAQMKNAIVSQSALATAARTIHLGDYVLLGKGELLTGGQEKDSILCDTVEAIFGAIYLTHGLEHTRALIERFLAPQMAASESGEAAREWKTELQDLCARHSWPPPEYRTTYVGPDHARVFSTEVIVNGAVAGRGSGSSKKVSTMAAACEACQSLEKSANSPN